MSTRFRDRHAIGDAKLQGFLDPYGRRLLEFRTPSAGTNHTTLVLQTDLGPAVLKIFSLRTQIQEEITNRLSFQTFLWKRGLPVAQTYPDRSGQLIGSQSLDGEIWSYVLMEYLPGSPLRPSDLGLIAEVAGMQAQLHLAAAEYHQAPVESGWPDLLKYFRRSYRRAGREAEDLGIPLRFLQYAADTYDLLEGCRGTFENLPSGRVHLDYDENNVLIEGGKVSGIIDFDDLSVLPFVTDLGFSISWWLTHADPSKFDNVLSSYLHAYCAVRALNGEELSALPLFIRMRNCKTALYNARRHKPQAPGIWQRLLDFDIEVPRLFR